MKRKEIKIKNIKQLIIAIILVVIGNIMGAYYFFRLDLTSEKRHTLSDNSKLLLTNLDDIIYIRIFLTGDDLPIGFKRLKKSTKELLDEFKVYAGSNFKFSFENPFENTTPKERAKISIDLRKKGIIPTNLKERTKEGKQSEKAIFPGALFTYKGREVAVNLLKSSPGATADVNLNNSLQSLEYEFTNAIKKLSRKAPQHIAFIQGHGELREPFVRDIAISLSEYYYVEKAYIGGETDSLNKYAAIIIAKPQKEFPEADKFAIDQYIMSGGKVLWLVDGVNAEMDSIFQGSTIAFYNSLGIDDQLFKYGVRINPVLLQDMHCANIGVNVASPNQAVDIKSFPWLYFPALLTQNNHPITKYVNVIGTQFLSSIDTVGANPEVEKTILLKTSSITKKIGVNIPIPIKLEFSTTNKNMFTAGATPVAVLLEGSFESSYSNRESNALVQKRGSKFAAKSVPTSMIVVSDGDIIKNEIIRSKGKDRLSSIGFNRYGMQNFPGNKEFIMNAVNYLCDDAGLMQLRSREIKLRLLNTKKVDSERTFWQLLNTILPIVVVLLVGLLLNLVRKRKYSR